MIFHKCTHVTPEYDLVTPNMSLREERGKPTLCLVLSQHIVLKGSLINLPDKQHFYFDD